MRKMFGFHLENIDSCQSAISSACSLLQQFQIDDECSDEIPESVKTGSIRGGLLASIEIAARYSAQSVEFLREFDDGQ